MNTTDLRADLGVQPEPRFEMTLPPGWTRSDTGEDVEAAMLAGVRDRLMREHKPAMYGEIRPLVEQAFSGMRREGAFAFFAATTEDPDTLWMPASIVASIRRAEPGQTLDELVRMLIREEGATPLRGDKGTLRFERERNVRLGTETIVNQSVIYLIPVPGSKRRRALQLVAGFGRSLEEKPDEPRLIAMKMLFDSCVASLRWHAGEPT